MERYIEKKVNGLFNGLTKNARFQTAVLPLFEKEPTKVEFEFKKKHNLEDRITMYKELKENHPTKIPLVIEYSKSKKILKVMVDWDEKVMRLFYKIRGHYKISNEEAIFLVTEKGRILTGSHYIGDVLREYEFDSKDMFMYLKVECENTFGN